MSIQSSSEVLYPDLSHHLDSNARANHGNLAVQSVSNHKDSNRGLPKDFRMAYHSGVTTRPPHRDNLPPEPKYWNSMLKHPYAAEFRKAAELENGTLTKIGTWRVVERQAGQTPIPPIWIFLYKYDSNVYVADHTLFTRYLAPDSLSVEKLQQRPPLQPLDVSPARGYYYWVLTLYQMIQADLTPRTQINVISLELRHNGCSPEIVPKVIKEPLVY